MATDRGNAGSELEADLPEIQILEAEPQQNLHRIISLIDACQRALGKLQPDKDPLLYARIQHKLGNAYSDLPEGNRAANLEQAIACYREALRFWTPETAPLDYATIQNNMGIAYSDLPAGDRGANLRKAIACYREALHFRTPEKAPLAYAIIQNNLGAAYNDLPEGDRTSNLQQAITCYQEALRFWTPERAPLDYAMAQHNLGIAYSNLPTGDGAAHLQQAIACYREALRFRTLEHSPLDYARTQNNLGIAYSDLPVGDRAANLQQAIACHQEALRFWTPEIDPIAYATIQNNLGTAYCYLPTGDRSANLQQAIICYREALRFWTPEATPLDYVTAQNNLGIVYRNLPTGDRTANLHQAIACYREALRFRTPEAAPPDYARTQNNLGAAYQELPAGDRATNLQHAIACYREALRFWTPESDPLDYAMAQHNLGAAYSDLPTGNRAANLQHAIACYREALRFRTPEHAPLDYARTQHNLGSAYRNLPAGDHAANLERAIACYQEALCFRTAGTTPLDYAKTQNNLGAAYSDLPTGDNATRLQHAITCYREALRFWTRETTPLEYRRANQRLADLYLTQQRWKEAFNTYCAAIGAGELLYRAGLSTESKAIELAENVALYRHAALSAVRCGQTTDALLLLERGRTRLLAEALRLRVPRPPHIPDEVWSTFERARAAIQAAQVSNSSLPPNEGDDLVQAYEGRKQAAYLATVALNAAIEQIRLYAPDFLHEIDLRDIQTALPDERTALIALCITEQGSLGFVAAYHSQDIQVVEVPAFTQADLDRLVVERDTNERATGGWLGAYRIYQTGPTEATFHAWQATITNTLTELGQSLLTPIFARLSPDVERIILLPSAELFLLPVHAAPLLDTTSDRLCDRYQVSYAPSIEVLANIRAKARRSIEPELYAVINPQSDPQLAFTEPEGAAIAELFAKHTLDKGQAGTKQRVLAAMQGCAYLHFACHGSYNWDDPATSGLELTDGRLTLAELQAGSIDLSATRVVTLSVCETGISDVMKGSAEEYVGIPAGFLLAGVPCVVSSLWAVPDLSTALLIERFYRNHLIGKKDFAAALGEAQVWMRELTVEEVAQYAERWYRQKQEAELFKLMRYYFHQAQQSPSLRPFAHPYYWAAFVVNGL